ncbi:hypothetical protein [Alphaproteobacteria bacterium endosymbiont of Tiliacea citrago]|uniref:hypothetical protein n=1 Tax=Alphaproteobacteria bacterium endosymbiont of Tiliacea citrago TaxID=3077944 RepID=UPI00313AD4B1
MWTNKTYKETFFHDSIYKTVKNLTKKFSNPIIFLKASWKDIAPDWAKEAIPYSIKNQTVFFKTKDNPMVLQYKEKEILKIINILISNSITKVKIFSI